MDNSPRTQTRRPDATFREAGVDELIKDVLRVGPAPTRSREAFATVVNIVTVGAALALLQPEPAVVAALAAVVAAFIAIRWIVGSRKWRNPASVNR